jgi:glycosyltransferase involved in cell wall biosynthesis
MKKRKQKLYVEASALTEKHVSGIGHTIVATIRALCENEDFTNRYQLVLLVSRDRRKQIARWHFPAAVRVKSLLIEKHALQVMLKYRFLPPMDLIVGRGLYLFPNYKNWPLLFSKSATYVYDVAYAIFPETIQPKNLQMLRRNLPRWINRTDRLVTISETSKAEIHKYLQVPTSKIDIAYCGVNHTDFFPQPKAEVSKLRARHKIPEKYILFLSNLEPRKNVTRLIEAYVDLPARIRQAHALVLVGSEGWLNEGIVERIEDLQTKGYKIIRPKQYVTDEELPIILSGATILVHPAIHEGFGLGPLQAMACGTPVAVSDIGAVREVVGTAGRYFDPSRTEAITDTMRELLEQPSVRRKLAAEGLEQSKKFTWQASAQELVAALDKVSGK